MILNKLRVWEEKEIRSYMLGYITNSFKEVTENDKFWKQKMLDFSGV